MKRVTAIVLILWVANMLLASPIALLKDGPKKIEIASKSEWLEDANHTLTISNLIYGDGIYAFKPVTEKIVNAGYSTSTFWVKFALKNQTNEPQDKIIEISGAIINDLTVYQYNPTKDSLVTFSRRGMDFPFKFSEIRNGSYIYKINIPAGADYIYFVKARNTIASLRLPIYLWNTDRFQLHSQKTDLLTGLIFGLMALIFLFAVVSIFALGEQLYFYYALYVLMLLAFLLAGKGLLFEWLWPNKPAINEISVIVLTALTMVSMIKFVQHFLDLPNKAKRFSLIINIVLAYLLLSTVFYYTDMGKELLNKVMLGIFNFSSFVISFAIFIYAIIGSYKRDRDSLITIFAFTPLLALSWAMNLRNNDLFPHLEIFDYRIPIGFTFEVLVFTFALAYRVKLINDEKKRLATDLFDLQTQRFKTVIQAVEKERKRIALDLHDGLGQLLSSVKINMSSLEEDIPEADKASYDTSLSLLDEACEEVRNISHNMMPSTLIRKGLVFAVKESAEKINRAGIIKVTIEDNDFGEQLRESLQIHIYRVTQEVLNNAIKYAEATEINIKFLYSSGRLFVSIKDNGKGFNTDEISQSSGIGWSNVFARAAMLNGSVKIDSKIGEGTTVQLEVPA